MHLCVFALSLVCLCLWANFHFEEMKYFRSPLFSFLSHSILGPGCLHVDPCHFYIVVQIISKGWKEWRRRVSHGIIPTGSFPLPFYFKLQPQNPNCFDSIITLASSLVVYFAHNSSKIVISPNPNPFILHNSSKKANQFLLLNK